MACRVGVGKEDIKKVRHHQTLKLGIATHRIDHIFSVLLAPLMCGVTKLDKIRNERIRGTTKVGEITKKVQEMRLKWYGHVM